MLTKQKKKKEGSLCNEKNFKKKLSESYDDFLSALSFSHSNVTTVRNIATPIKNLIVSSMLFSLIIIFRH
jgi:hypothetical protein